MLPLSRRTGVWRLPDQITLRHGPHDVLGRFILLADRAVRDRGIRLSLESDFFALLAVNEANRAHWHPIPPSFDPRLGAIGPENGFWISGRNDLGEVVLTQAVRLYELQSSTLHDELASLRFFYSNRERQAQPGERCEVNTSAAAGIKGRVVYSGGTWFRPDYRGRGLASIMPRLSRSIALSRWDTDFTFSLVTRALVNKNVARHYGYRRIDFSVDWRGSVAGPHLDFALVWMPRDELLFDVEATMVLHAPDQQLAA